MENMGEMGYEVLILSLDNKIESWTKQILAMRKYILEAEKEKKQLEKELKQKQADDIGITEPEEYHCNCGIEGCKDKKCPGDAHSDFGRTS